MESSVLLGRNEDMKCVNCTLASTDIENMDRDHYEELQSLRPFSNFMTKDEKEQKELRKRIKGLRKKIRGVESKIGDIYTTQNPSLQSKIVRKSEQIQSIDKLISKIHIQISTEKSKHLSSLSNQPNHHFFTFTTHDPLPTSPSHPKISFPFKRPKTSLSSKTPKSPPKPSRKPISFRTRSKHPKKPHRVFSLSKRPPSDPQNFTFEKENMIFQTPIDKRLQYLAQKVEERTQKALKGYQCLKIIKQFEEFKQRKKKEYEVKGRERKEQFIKDNRQLKELRDVNKLLRVEVYRREQIGGKRLKSAFR